MVEQTAAFIVAEDERRIRPRSTGEQRVEYVRDTSAAPVCTLFYGCSSSPVELARSMNTTCGKQLVRIRAGEVVVDTPECCARCPESADRSSRPTATGTRCCPGNSSAR